LAINNRNLETMEVDNKKASDLLDNYSTKRPVLGFSGYHSPESVNEAYEAGLSGVLIGTALSKSDHPQELVGTIRRRLGN